ncbi:lipopolysaccharide assembly protein LapA domain-containing protein [Rubripirellula reticaptiva]|uniref:Lipopolysaccharide assembly protein A domain-containing protein n=1 Tax=Rubripirellula reticaptiva TaxID=2528013 RepID=A0A5C6EKY6_9BACT|nr:LapA family protein [Rubripirellula reticaptiva]TWU48266.1 hypothetical protein Poly59_51120 [Rubripirellula reticaptiva]
MQKIRWFFLIVGILLALAMSLQNNTLTDVRLLWLDAQFPLSVLLLVATAIGFLFGALLTASMLRSRKTVKKEPVVIVDTKKAAAKNDLPADTSPLK